MHGSRQLRRSRPPHDSVSHLATPSTAWHRSSFRQGDTADVANTITTNLGSGIVAGGIVSGSVVQGNVMAGNLRGDIVDRNAYGLTVIRRS